MSSLIQKRINRVIDYVRSHLQQPLSLEVLADVAGLSPFHFHRIFKDQIKESLNAFVVRQRLECAVRLLQSDHNLTLSNAAYAAGFQSLSDFSRNFKSRYGLSASRWNRKTPLNISKIRQTEIGFELYDAAVLQDMNFAVEVKTIPVQTLAYWRVKTPYETDCIQIGLEKLMLGLVEDQCVVTGSLIGMSFDDPEVTPLEQCFYDWAVPVQSPKNHRSKLSYRRLPALQVASLEVKGDMIAVDQAWQYLYRYWLIQHDVLPTHFPAMEVYGQNPQQSGWQHWDLACWLPITSEID